jgi:hypothetical protein
MVATVLLALIARLVERQELLLVERILPPRPWLVRELVVASRCERLVHDYSPVPQLQRPCPEQSITGSVEGQGVPSVMEMTESADTMDAR